MSSYIDAYPVSTDLLELLVIAAAVGAAVAPFGIGLSCRSAEMVPAGDFCWEFTGAVAARNQTGQLIPNSKLKAINLEHQMSGLAADKSAYYTKEVDRRIAMVPIAHASQAVATATGSLQHPDRQKQQWADIVGISYLADITINRRFLQAVFTVIDIRHSAVVAAARKTATTVNNPVNPFLFYLILLLK